MLSLLYCLKHNNLRKQHLPWDSVLLPFLFLSRMFRTYKSFGRLGWGQIACKHA